MLTVLLLAALARGGPSAAGSRAPPPSPGIHARGPLRPGFGGGWGWEYPVAPPNVDGDRDFGGGCNFARFGEFCDEPEWSAPSPEVIEPPAGAPPPTEGVWVEPGDPAALGLDPHHLPEGWRDPKVLVLVPPPP